MNTTANIEQLLFYLDEMRRTFASNKDVDCMILILDLIHYLIFVLLSFSFQPGCIDSHVGSIEADLYKSTENKVNLFI